MKTRKLPEYVTNAFLIKLLKHKTITFLSYWILQGILYMNPYEKVFKLLLDVIGTFVIGLSLLPFFKDNHFLLITTAFVISHTLNMLLNGHFFALGRFLGFTKISADRYFDYIHKMKIRWDKRNCVKLVLIYGSLSREKITETSDLDVRVLCKENIWNIIECCFWIFIERSIGLFSRFPIDIYLETNPSGLKRMRADEIPVVLVSVDSPEEYFDSYTLYN